MGERLEVLIAERDISARVAALAQDIDTDYRGRRLSLIVVLKGAVIFAADLMRHIEAPCTFDVVSAASYGAGMRSSGTVVVTFPNLLSDTYLGAFLDYVRAGEVTNRARARMYTPEEVARVVEAAGFDVEIDAGVEIFAVCRPR